MEHTCPSECVADRGVHGIDGSLVVGSVKCRKWDEG